MSEALSSLRIDTVFIPIWRQLMNKMRIRFKLKSGQWTYWLNQDEVARYRNDHIECAVIEETMSYEEAMKVLKKYEGSAEPKFKEYYKGKVK